MPAGNKSTLIFLLSSIGLIVLPHIDHVPPTIFAFFGLMLGWRFLGIWNPNRLPGKRVVFLLAILGLVLLYSRHQGLLGRDAGTNLFIIALALKLFEMKTPRDLYLIVYLAFIVGASQFLYEQTILMAVYIVAVCCALLATLIAINSIKPETGKALKLAAVIMAQAAPMAVVIFILFPRVEPPRWMLFFDEPKTKTGLSDTMEPGSITDLGLSEQLVFRVKFSGAIPPPHQLYWRGPVMSDTDGKRWTQVKNLAFKKPPAEPAVTGRPYHYKIMMEPQNKNWVFALDMPAAYAPPLSRNANYQLVTSENPDKRAEYRITSYPDYNTGVISLGDYQDATRLPGAPSDKIKQLVDRLQGFNSRPENFIRQLMKHFRTENFRYTLKPPLLEENPIETFLFKTRSGFCSHYAAAFVYLMRAAGIPARVVTGFQGGGINEVGDFLEIRQADAHAWAEVWLEKGGWTRFDPTAAIAPERIEQTLNVDRLVLGGEVSFTETGARARAAFNWLRVARQLMDNADYNWQRWVINYNSANQSRFLSSYGIDDFKAMIYWMAALIALLTLLLSAFLFYRKQKTADKALLIYGRFCGKLAKRGLIRTPGEGARDFAERVKIRLPERSADVDQITAVFIKLRYGRHSTPQDLQRLKERVSLFKI